MLEIGYSTAKLSEEVSASWQQTTINKGTRNQSTAAA